MNRRVLLIGGTGIFGERLARHLCPMGGIDLIVTSRNELKAQQLAARLVQAHPYASVSAIQLDHRDNLQSRLETVKPFIVIDCSGPFQRAGYGVARTVLEAGAHMIDLADARDYLEDYAGALDQVAKRHAAVGLAGASSTPALSASAVRSLSAGWQRIDSIDICITPGGKSEVGRAVISAIMSYAGRDIPVWREGRLSQTPGWLGARTVAMPDLGRRRVAPVETLDAQLLGPRHAVTSRVRFAAGLESLLEQCGMQLVARLARWRLLRRPERLVPILLAVRNLTRLTTSDRGGMSVEVKGLDATGTAVRVQYSLLAKEGHGPYVPVLPAAAAVKALLRGGIEPGAHLAERVLSLSAIEAEMASYSIETKTERVQLGEGIFEEHLGRETFQMMPAALRTLHGAGGVPVWSGRAEVRAAEWFVPRLLARLFGFPASGSEIPVTVTVDRDPGEDGPGRETWVRNFSGQRFSSVLRHHGDGTFWETFGPFSFRLGLAADRESLVMPVTGWKLGPVPLPRALAPRSRTREYEDEQGRFCFDVELTLPVLGLFAHYRGWLVPGPSAPTA
ncbi:DUF4166 domain-containing protein [Anderseniella sp. Alg231-50]|uniref:DUF4166 domain-containing protein n=1 Tax=Anderseniella sp. Alg231-50 TaxID=1922226 RepID=UPI00307C1266